jgi:hypothetical protein
MGPFYVWTLFGPFQVSQNAGSSYVGFALEKAGRVGVATSRIGAQGMLVEMGAGCQGIK